MAYQGRPDPQSHGLRPGTTLYDIRRTGSARDCITKVLHPISRTYIAVKGVLDSGAFTNVGSLQLHAELCSPLRKLSKDVFMKLPSGEVIPSLRAGRMTVRAENEGEGFEVFPDILVYLVDNPNWNELLIGRPALKDSSLLPEQNFRSNQKSDQPGNNNNNKSSNWKSSNQDGGQTQSNNQNQK